VAAAPVSTDQKEGKGAPGFCKRGKPALIQREKEEKGSGKPVFVTSKRRRQKAHLAISSKRENTRLQRSWVQRGIFRLQKKTRSQQGISQQKTKKKGKSAPYADQRKKKGALILIETKTKKKEKKGTSFLPQKGGREEKRRPRNG